MYSAQLQSQAGLLTTACQPATWINEGDEVTVGGIHIRGAQFYLGQHLPSSVGGRNEKFLVDPSLLVAHEDPDFEGATIDYWPDYAEMTPRARLAFLLWMAEERSRAAIHPAYVLLYIYGIERRLLLDRVESEVGGLLRELLRIADRYADHVSIRKVLRGLLDAANLVLTGTLTEPSNTGQTDLDGVPLAIAYQIGKAAAAGRSIDPDLVFDWVTSDPTRSFSYPDGSSIPELRAAFREHARAFRPEGIFFPASAAPPLTCTYRAQGGSFVLRLDSMLSPVPDLTHSPTARMEAHVLVRDTLARFRSHGRRGPGLSSAEPSSDLASTGSHSLPHGKSTLHAWAWEQLAGDGSISIRAALKRWRGQQPRVLARSEIERLADMLAETGIGIVPDPRYDLEPSRITEDALLFRMAAPSDGVEPASEPYLRALLLTMVAMSVARSDGEISPEELALIDKVIETTDQLSKNDQLRLKAERHWMHMRPLPLAPIFDAIGRLTDRQRRDLASLVVDMVLADGRIPEAERAFGAILLNHLGLSPREISLRLSLASAVEVGPVVNPSRTNAITHRQNVGQPEMTYPPGSRGTGEEPLELLRTANVRADDHRLSRVAITQGGRGANNGQVTEELDISGWPLAQLNDNHVELLNEIVRQVEWNRKALEQIARQHRLMPDGAIETLNDWAHDASGELLLEVEDGGLVHVNQDVIKAFKGAA